MKFSEILLVSALTVVSVAQASHCKKEVSGFPCCESNCEVYYVDEDGEWSIENGDWCLMPEECYDNNDSINTGKLQYLGVSESSGEFGESHLPGTYNKHYIYPDINAIKTTYEQGMNAFRICNRWERLQHELFGELNEFDITEYKKVVDATTALGAIAIVDPHNYARYYDEVIGSKAVPIEAYTDFWTKIAELFKDNEKVWFGLMNEPHDMKTDDWFKAARAAVDAIRATGAKNHILIPGNGWTGAWSWGKQAWYGESNADVALRYFSSKDENIVFEVHQYFDKDYSGSGKECIQRPCQNLAVDFVEWLKKNDLRGWIGEFGSPLTDECKACAQEFIEYLQKNNKYVLGAQWWAAGPWWGENDMSIEPNDEKAFPGQMAWFKPYLPGPSELTEVPIFINKKVYCKGCVVTGTGGDGSLWGWENSKACEIDKEGCGFNNNNGGDNKDDENKCWSEALGYKCCSHCVSILKDNDGSWGAENGEWCGISTSKCSKSNEACWSVKHGYPCCENCTIYLEDDLGKWGVLNNEWCGIPDTCKA